MLLSTRLLTSPIALVSAGLLALLFIFGTASRSTNSSPRLPHLFTHPSENASPPSSSKVPGTVTQIEGLPPPPDTSIPINPPHPIDDLIKTADTSLQRLLRSDIANDDVGEAAKRYRGKRKRHPPPGFDKWFEYARKQDAIMLESLFDQIYHDLEPFWAMDAAQMRQRTIEWPFAFSIRDGTIRQRKSRPVAGEWMEYWEGMFKEIVEFLPDVDIAINNLDEPRIVVPWEDMGKHMQKALTTRNRKRPASESAMVTTYPKRDTLSFVKEDIASTGQAKDGPWLSKESFWQIAHKACPPSSKARGSKLDPDLSSVPEFPQEFPQGSNNGYVSNFTESKSVCAHPHLRNLHGSFVRPRWNSVNTTLFPLFAGCKIAGISNEILLPAAKYFSTESEFSFSGTETPWKDKKDGMIWRGQATGGAHTKKNWKRFHRHRFVAMTNGSQVALEEFRRDHQPLPAVHAPPTNLEDQGQPQHMEVKGAFAGVEIPDPPEISFDDPSGDVTEPTSIDTPATGSDIITADTTPLEEHEQPQKRQNAPLHALPFPPPRNIPLPSRGKNPYHLAALSTSPSTLSTWLSPKTSIGFDHLMCDPWGWSILGPGTSCAYLDPYYRVLERVEMGEMFSHKYLPDVDGNSYSGRYLAFLRSGTVPLKATIWDEWFDSRLIAWKHFVPVDNTYADLWGVMEYFWGYGNGNEDTTTTSDANAHADPDANAEFPYPLWEKEFVTEGFNEGESRDTALRRASHDEVARRIAEEGREWAGRVLRREDMLVYVYRLVLEYARVVSEERERMGWVGDLF